MNKKKTRILIILLSAVCLILLGVIIFQSFSINKSSNQKNEKKDYLLLVPITNGRGEKFDK